ncbi:MAG: cell division protein FtsA, partial [Oceanospirillales bacterium]|nr:cell division protein FtsA [Oceanospirillales bacterium]MBR9889897.1 cell division protein FtsA [Oceanospirillales bacterium]
KMEGAVELAEEIFHMPVRLALPSGVRGMGDILNSPIYATGIGLLQYAKQDIQHLGEAVAVDDTVERPNVLNRMKAWFQGNF